MPLLGQNLLTIGTKPDQKAAPNATSVGAGGSSYHFASFVYETFDQSIQMML